MASGDGVITRKDIITDEALSFGKEYRKNVDEAIQANNELIKQFKELNKVSGDYRKAQSNFDYKKAKQDEALLNQEILNLIKQMEQYEKSLERVKQEKLKTEKELFRMAQENIRLSKTQAQAQKSTTSLTMEERVQRQLANKAEKEAVLSKMGLIGAYQKLNAQRTEAKKKLLDLIASEKASNTEIRNAQREFDVLDKKVRKADNAAGDFGKTVGNYKTAFSGLSNLMGAFGIVGGITGAVMLGKSIYETTKQIQAQEIALKMLSETEETYSKNKEFLTRITEQYGLELMTTTNAYKNYFASAKTSVEEGKLAFSDMQMIFEKVSKSSSTLGLSVEQQEGAFLALSQMLSKGTVQSEELRGQLGERLPGAFEVMAKALNVSTMELGEMLKKGEVLAADVLPKFAIAYEKAIGADQIERVETLAAAENRAANKWTYFVDSLNEGQGIITKTGISFFNLTSDILDLLGAKQKLSEEIKNEQLQLNILIGKITAANIKEEERIKLIEELKRNYPDYISLIKDEDFSNQNLIKTLQKVNSEYRERIRLQVQNERVTDLIKERDDKARISEESRLELMEKLIVLNEKYQLGFNITTDNAVQMSDEVIKALQKVEDKLKLGDAIGYLTGNQRIKTLADRVELYEDAVAKVNEEIEKQQAIYENINKSSENQEYSLRTQLGILKDFSTNLFIARQEAEKLGGVIAKDFDPFSLDSIKAFISKKTNESGESEKEKNEREAAERKAKAAREKALREAEKNEDERLKKLKESYEAEIDLLIYKTQTEADILKTESTNEKNTADERYDALMTNFQLEEELLRLNTEKQLTLSRSFQKEKTAFTDQEIKDLINGNQIKSELTNAELLILEKFYTAQEKLRKGNQKGLEDNAEFEAKIIAANTAAIISGNDINRLKELTKVEEDFKKLSFKNNEERIKAVEDREKRILEINRKYDKINTEDQIKQMIQTLEILGIENEKIIELKKKLAELQNQLVKNENDNSNTDAQTEEEKRKKKIEDEKEAIEKLRASFTDFSNGFAETMGMNGKVVEDFVMLAFDKFQTLEDKIRATFSFMKEFTNAIFQQRIDEIQYEIDLTQEKHDKELENFTGTEYQKEALRVKQDAEIQKLEDKKRKERIKQANAEKAFNIAQAVWNTAAAIMQAYAQLGPIGGTIAAILVGTLGAYQINQIKNQPIPKYKTGRKGGPEEIAIVGDGGVHEVIEHKDGSAELTPKRDTLVKLLEGDTVHASLDLYRKSRRNKINNDIYKDKLTFDAYHSLAVNDYSSLEKEIIVLQDILKRKNMSTTVNVPKIDFGHQFWLEKQKNW